MTLMRVSFLVALAAWGLVPENGPAGEPAPQGEVVTMTVSLRQSGLANVRVPEHAKKVIIVAEGGYCLPKLRLIVGRFFAQVSTALEIGVEPKRGLIKRAALNIALGYGVRNAQVSNPLNHARRVLKFKGKGDGIDFWAELFDEPTWKERTWTYTKTVSPPVGETRTAVFDGCYTEEDLNSLKLSMVQAARLLVQRVDQAVAKAREALARQGRTPGTTTDTGTVGVKRH